MAAARGSAPAVAEDASTASQRPTILLIGDSITQHSFRPGGWGTRLASWYMRKADVINRGFSGYNSAWALEAFPKVRPDCHDRSCFPSSDVSCVRTR
jgi:isoamyl acetate esterase